MLKVTMFLVATLISVGTAFAQTSGVMSDDLVKQAKQACMTQEYAGSNEIKLISRLQCLNGIDLLQLKKRQEAGDKKVDAALARMQAQADTFEKMLKAQAEATKVAEAQTKSVAPAPRRRAVYAGGPPVMMTAPYAIIDPPGRYVAATWEMPEMKASRIMVKSFGLALSAVLHLGGSVRLVVMKNGQPLAVAHPGMRYEEFYADLNSDGKPDRLAYKGVDPTFTDQVYVSYRPGDVLQVYFLVSSGKMLAIPGLSPQVMWKTYAAYKVYPSDETMGRWDISVYDGAKIR